MRIYFRKGKISGGSLGIVGTIIYSFIYTMYWMIKVTVVVPVMFCTMLVKTGIQITHTVQDLLDKRRTGMSPRI